MTDETTEEAPFVALLVDPEDLARTLGRIVEVGGRLRGLPPARDRSSAG